MPRFILVEVEKPLLNPDKVYVEKEDHINLIYGSGRDNNINLYDIDNPYINHIINTYGKDNVFVKSLMKIKIEREEFNIKDIYNYAKKKIYENTKTKIPKYEDVKDVLSRKVYDRTTGNWLYTTNNMFLANSPMHKADNEISTILIGGDYNLEIKKDLNVLVELAGGKYANHPLIKKTIVEYYAVSYNVVYIEDNCLNIFPYEYDKYLPERDQIIDKLYKVKALEVLVGLTDEISSRWIDGKSLLLTYIGDGEEDVEKCIFPPDSYDCGIFGPFGDDDYGEYDD